MRNRECSPASKGVGRGFRQVIKLALTVSGREEISEYSDASINTIDGSVAGWCTFEGKPNIATVAPEGGSWE